MLQADSNCTVAAGSSFNNTWVVVALCEDEEGWFSGVSRISQWEAEMGGALSPTLAYPTLARLRECAEKKIWPQMHVLTVTVVRWHDQHHVPTEMLVV